MGVPKKSGFIEEAKRGALGGAIVGGALGPIAVGTAPNGGMLLKVLMKKGMSRNKAMALLMGSGAVAGAGMGAVGGGLDSGLMFGLGD
jgi:hypothetical protein